MHDKCGCKINRIYTFINEDKIYLFEINRSGSGTTTDFKGSSPTSSYMFTISWLDLAQYATAKCVTHCWQLGTNYNLACGSNKPLLNTSFIWLADSTKNHFKWSDLKPLPLLAEMCTWIQSLLIKYAKPKPSSITCDQPQDWKYSEGICDEEMYHVCEYEKIGSVKISGTFSPGCNICFKPNKWRSTPLPSAASDK